jgi:hypothetical protein
MVASGGRNVSAGFLDPRNRFSNVRIESFLSPVRAL